MGGGTHLNVCAALGASSIACVVVIPPLMPPSMPRLMAPAPANTSSTRNLRACDSSSNATTSARRACSAYAHVSHPIPASSASITRSSHDVGLR